MALRVFEQTLDLTEGMKAAMKNVWSTTTPPALIRQKQIKQKNCSKDFAFLSRLVIIFVMCDVCAFVVCLFDKLVSLIGSGSK